MSLSPETLLASPPETSLERSSVESRKRWFELLLVLLVAFAGPLTSALYMLNAGARNAPHATNMAWLVGLLHEVTGLLVLAYVLSRGGRRFKDLGLSWSARDFGTGLLVFVGSVAAYVMGSLCIQAVYYARYHAFHTGPSAKDFFAHPGIGFIPYVLFNPFFEELIVRAYLMTEVRDLTGSPVLAAALSVAVQFAYHLYYGWLGALSISFLFIAFAVYYARARRALPIIVAHGVFDIYTLLRLW